MKVLFIDSWTKGIRCFIPVSQYLTQKNIESLLVHYGSWDAEPGRPHEELIDGLLCRDIAYYRSRLLYKVLERERPDCIVTLTTNNLIDRAKILAARALGIPIVFLMHGIIATTEAAVEEQIDVLKPTLRRKRFSKIPKHLSHIIPNYIFSGMKLKTGYALTAAPYRVMMNTFRFPEKWKQYPDPSTELQCDLALAWGKAYKDFLVEKYGYSPQAVSVVGHPPLDKASRLMASPPDNQECSLFLHSHGISPDTSNVLYIEGAFAFSGYQGWTDDSLLAHLLEMVELCSIAGKHLIIKLHPSTERAQWIQSCLEGRATIIQQADSEMLIWNAESVIGHSSTLINSAIVLHKPVFIPRWGISRSIPANFDDIAPVSVCHSPEQLKYGISHSKESRDNLSSRRDCYIQHYLDPLDGNSQERIGQAVAQLAYTRAQTSKRAKVA